MSAMSTRLRYLLSASVCWVVVPFAVLFETINLLDRNRPWRDDFLWATDWAGTSVFLVVPFLAGLVAADTSILMSAHRRDLTLSTPRTGMSLLRPAVLAGGACLVVHLLFLVPYAMEAQPMARNLLPALYVVLAQLSVLMFFALFGAFLGAVLPLPWGPLLAAVSAPALMWLLGRNSGLFSPFDVGGSTSSLLGLALSPRFALAQTVWLVLALGVTVALLLWRWPWSGGTRFRVVNTAPFLLLFLVVLALQQGPQMDRLEVVASPPQRECTGSSPVICVYPEHRRFARMVRVNVERIYAGVPPDVADALPRRIVERYPGGTPPRTAGVSAIEVLPDSFSSDKISMSATAIDLVTPWRCPQIFASEAPPERYFRAADLLSKELAAAGKGGTALKDPARVQEFLGLLERVMSCQILRS